MPSGLHLAPMHIFLTRLLTRKGIALYSIGYLVGYPLGSNTLVGWEMLLGIIRCPEGQKGSPSHPNPRNLTWFAGGLLYCDSCCYQHNLDSAWRVCFSCEWPWAVCVALVSYNLLSLQIQVYYSSRDLAPTFLFGTPSVPETSAAGWLQLCLWGVLLMVTWMKCLCGCASSLLVRLSVSLRIV